MCHLLGISSGGGHVIGTANIICLQGKVNSIWFRVSGSNPYRSFKNFLRDFKEYTPPNILCASPVA